MKEKEVTINYMLDLCQRLSQAGYGEMVVKCGEDIVHEDEIIINFSDKEMNIEGCIFNNPIVESVKTFLDTIKKAEEKLYSDINHKNNGTP